MSALGIIGSSAMTGLRNFEQSRTSHETTPYGEPSGLLIHGRLFDQAVVFLSRHGEQQAIPPHLINYRANLWALKHAGIEKLVAIYAVGGISDACVSGQLVIPSDLIDYTSGRDHTIFDGSDQSLDHIEFSPPYAPELRQELLGAAKKAGLDVVDGGVYGAVQGPRLETTAEIRRLERDGCDIVGMTGMPEAALAKELGIRLAACAMIVNQAAGKASGGIHDEIAVHRAAGLAKIYRLLENYC